MAFEVSIESFEGPLDLMLHLIKENKLDLLDLDMNILCDQYLEYINTMEQMQLEIASEFLSELAGLIEYKSKKLLPKVKVEIEEEYEEDQRDKLVRRLLEYKRFKEVSETFAKKYDERQRLMSKPISEQTTTWMKQNTSNEITGDPYDLIKAMNRVLRRMSFETYAQTTVNVKEMSVEERNEQIEKRLKDFKGKMSFETLCKDCDSVHMVIVSFLSILDLIRRGFIYFHIDDNNEIWLLKGEDEVA